MSAGRSRRSLSSRLALAGALATAAVLAVVFVLVWATTRRVLEREFDADLEDRTQTVVDHLVSLEWNLTRADGLIGVDAELAHDYVQVYVQGRPDPLLSRNLGEQRLPRADMGDAERRIGTWSEEELTTYLPGIGSLRMVSVACDVPHLGPVQVEVGTSRQPLLDAMRTLDVVFAVLLPAAVFAAALVTGWGVRRALGEVDRVAAEAARRDRELLFEPLPVPAGDDAMTRLIAAVNALLHRSRDLLHAQERFNAHAAHELKSPVARVLGHAQVLLQRPREAGEHVAFARLVEEEMRRLRDVVESLLVLARLDQTARRERADVVPLTEVCADAVGGLDAAARERSVTIRLELPEEEVTVAGDPALLAVALGNVVRNALRFAPAGSAVTVRGAAAGGEIRVAVEDQGPGFSAEALAHACEPFWSGDGGSGMGLALAAAVARVHAGRLAAENLDGAGARVVLTLPAVAPTA